ncbi:MAG: two-component regulator propeller domain-containing protein, partial [Flavisolibacter sp.]
MRNCIIILLFFFSSLHAQIPSTLKQFSLYYDQPEALRKAGISGVRSLFRDGRKLTWIGTENGLYRFDGTNLIYRRHVPGDSTSIPNNTIISIAEDKKGNIWIGTIGGVGCINPFNLKCKTFRHEKNNLDENFDNKVLVDAEGKVWTGNKMGLFLLDEKQNSFRCVWHDTTPGKKLSGYVTALVEWNPRTLVIGTFDDLVIFDKSTGRFIRKMPLGKDILVTRLLLDSSNRLWIGTWGNGCFISDNTLQYFQQFKWEMDLPSNLSNIVIAIAETSSEKEHCVWISSGKWIGKFILDTSRLVNFKKFQVFTLWSQDIAAKSNQIYCMMADQENYVWSGGETVAKFPAGRNMFQVFPFTLKGSMQNMQMVRWKGKEMMALSIWHEQEGLVLLDTTTGEFTRLPSLLPKDPYSFDISGLVTDRLHRFWLSSLSGGFVFDENFRLLKSLTKGEKKQDLLTGQKTNDILIHRDTVWMALYKKGIDLYDLQYHKLRFFSNFNGCGLEDDIIQKIFEDSRGRIWFCGNTFLYRYLPGTASFKKFDFSSEHIGFFPNDIAELPNGHLLVASESGLYNLDPEKNSWTRIESPLLENEDGVYSVCVDAKGEAWYLTHAHLVNYQFTTSKFTLYGEEDGLHPKLLQCIRCLDGRNIFLAEAGRLMRFDPENWEKKMTAPGLLVHSIQVNDSSIQENAPVRSLRLQYDQNKIAFEFDAINYIKPEQNEYAYQLSGIDKDWVSSSKNFASYANLSPGSYVFHVKAANYAGMWSREYTIAIDISPPFWLRWWFLLLALLFVGGIFFLVVRYISQRNLRERILRLEKEQAVEKERNRIARDMHDDLGSGLTKIAILSEVAKTQLQKKEEAAVQLEKISYSSRELVDNLQDI